MSQKYNKRNLEYFKNIFKFKRNQGVQNLSHIKNLSHWVQYPQIWVMNEARKGSIDDRTVPENPLEMMNSVIVATMRTEASGFTSWRAVLNVDGWMQSMTWADFMTSREAMFNPVMFLRTFASPIIEKSGSDDILNDANADCRLLMNRKCRSQLFLCERWGALTNECS